MNHFDVLRKNSLCEKLFVAGVAFEFFLAFVHLLKVDFQLVFGREELLADAAFERLGDAGLHLAVGFTGGWLHA